MSVPHKYIVPTNRRVVYCLIAMSFWLLAACGGGGGGSSSSSSSPTPPPVPVVTGPHISGTINKDISINSAKVGATYPIQVYVPADYATTTDTLPVIYALDGDGIIGGTLAFPQMASVLEKAGVRAVLVGIGASYRRGADYLMPGASQFYEFVTTELIPVVEARYRINPNTRTVSGHSYGGLFVLLAMEMDRPDKRYFANFIAQDASVWAGRDIATLEHTMFIASGGNLPGTTLILSSASTGGNDVYVEYWYQYLLLENYQGLSLYRLPTYETTHEQMFSPSFRDSITILFK